MTQYDEVSTFPYIHFCVMQNVFYPSLMGLHDNTVYIQLLIFHKLSIRKLNNKKIIIG